MKLLGKRRRPGAGLFLLCANLGLVSFSFLAIVYVAGLASPLLNLLLVAAALVLQLALLGLFLTPLFLIPLTWLQDRLRLGKRGAPQPATVPASR